MHKAVTFSHQLALSCAAPLTSAQLVHLSCLDSFSTILLHVVLGRPTFLFPLGCHSIATMQSSSPSLLSMWPIQFHLLHQISSLIQPLMHGTKKRYIYIIIAKHLSVHLKFSMRLQREAKTLNHLYNLG